MKANRHESSAVTAALAAVIAVSAQRTLRSSRRATVPVTVENFIRAETDLYFSAVALKEGGFGKFEHHRERRPDRRSNRHPA